MHSIPGCAVLERSTGRSGRQCAMAASPWIQPQRKASALPPESLELWITNRLFLLDDWSALHGTSLSPEPGLGGGDAGFEARSVVLGCPALIRQGQHEGGDGPVRRPGSMVNQAAATRRVCAPLNLGPSRAADQRAEESGQAPPIPQQGHRRVDYPFTARN